jgi:uncharacterized integral membrane protein
MSVMGTIWGILKKILRMIIVFLLGIINVIRTILYYLIGKRR